MQIPAKLKSRKLWITVLSAAVVSLASQLGLSQDDAQHLVEVVSAYLIAQGAHDAGGAVSGKGENFG